MNTLLSIITLYRYDPTIFDGLIIPEQLDKEILVDNILLELGELELLYNDPNMMKFAIERWSAKESKKWNDLYTTTTFEYNPIHNYDRIEDFTDTETRQLAKNNTQTRNLTGSENQTRNLTGSENQIRSLTGSENETRNLTGSENEIKNLSGTSAETRNLKTGVDGTSETTDKDVQGGNNSTKKEVSAYNVSTLATDAVETQTLGATNNKTVNTKTNQTGTDTGTVNTTTTDTGTDNKTITDSGTVNKATVDSGTVNATTSDSGTVNATTTNSGTLTDIEADTGTVEMHRIGNAKGNIGVTTTQQMIEAERNVVKFNLYEYIIESFKLRFCILVY